MRPALYLLAAVALVHAALFALDPHPYYMLGDSIGYLQSALVPVPSLKAPLGYPLALFPVLAPTRELAVAVTFQIVVLFGAAGLWASVVGRGMRRWGAAAFVLICLWPRHVYYAHAFLSEILAVFWVAAFVWFLFRRGAGAKSALGAGAALGAAILTRSALAALLPGALVALALVAPKTPLRAHALRIGLLGAGLLLVLLPYAGVNRLVHGAFVVTAFDGWTLFGTVGRHVDVEAIEDPIVREVFRERSRALVELSPSALRWSPRSPAAELERRARAGASSPDLRDRLARDGPLATVRHLLARDPHPDVEVNATLRAIALSTIAREPLACAGDALGRLVAYVIGQETYRTHFNARSGVAPAPRNFRLAKLRTLLAERFDTDVAERSRARLHEARYAAYHLRGLLLVLPALVLVRACRRRRIGADEALVLGFGALALSLSLGTAAFAEIYDRYTMPGDAFGLGASVVALRALHVRRGETSSF